MRKHGGVLEAVRAGLPIRCGKCDLEKQASEFHRHKASRAGIRGTCKSCVSTAIKEHRRLNPRVRLPEIARASGLKARYGMTLEQYAAMLAAQGGGCAICGSATSSGCKNSFHVDHNHKTGNVRGILCQRCNTGIGSLREDATILRRAISYLEKHTGENL